MGLTVQPSNVLEANEPDEGIELRPLVSSDELMIVRVDIAPGSTLRVPYHPHEQAGSVAEGSVAFTGDDRRAVRKGDGYYVPPGHGNGVEGGDEGGLAIDAFASAREDYREKSDHLRNRNDA